MKLVEYILSRYPVTEDQAKKIAEFYVEKSCQFGRQLSIDEVMQVIMHNKIY